MPDLLYGPVKRFRAADGEGGVGFGGYDVELGHGPGSGFPLGVNACFGAAAFAHVAVDAAVKADLVGGVDVDGEAVEGQELGVMEGEDTLDDDDAFRGDGFEGFGDAGVGLEVVDGAVDGLARGEAAEVLDEEFAFERVRVIEVALVAAVERELGEVAVVEVEREECGVERGGEFAGEGGFAGAGTAGDGEDRGVMGEAELFRVRHGFSLARASVGLGCALDGC